MTKCISVHLHLHFTFLIVVLKLSGESPFNPILYGYSPSWTNRSVSKCWSSLYWHLNLGAAFKEELEMTWQTCFLGCSDQAAKTSDLRLQNAKFDMHTCMLSLTSALFYLGMSSIITHLWRQETFACHQKKSFFLGGKKIHFHFKVKGMFSSMLEPVTVVIANKIVFRI